jgi:serine/threonine protein kinase
MTESAQSIGRYRVIKRLALGGMGEINLAKQVGLRGFERVVILTTLLPELTQDESFLEQFLDEARVAATLNHPNIVAILELGQAGDRYFMAMEYIDGVDLGFAQRLAHQEKRPLTPREVAGVVGRAAVGLDHAHHAPDSEGNALAIVHRDVSPSNIMLRGDGVVKVVDFGIARAANQGHRTGANVVKGKLRYMSPEQVVSDPLDMRSDQFSLGVVLWELLSGVPLFRGESPLDVMRGVLTSPIRKPSDVNHAVPTALDRIVLRMLERQPASRFPRLLDVAAELQSFLDAHGGAADADLRELGTWLVGLRGNPLDGQKSTRAGSARSCHRCGEPLSVSDKFCAECGTAVSSTVGSPARNQGSGEAHAVPPVRITPSAAPAPVSGMFEEWASAEPEPSIALQSGLRANPGGAMEPQVASGAPLAESVADEPPPMELILDSVAIQDPLAAAGAALRGTPSPGSAALAAPTPATPPSRRVNGVAFSAPPALPAPAPAPAPGLGPPGKPSGPAARQAASRSGERWLQFDDVAEAGASLVADEPSAFPGLLLAARVQKPLVGRAAELQKITKGIEHVKRGGFAGAVWVGAPGVGKTRLLEEAQVLAHAGGLMVVRVTGNRFGMPVTLDLVHQLLAGVWCALELGPGAGPPPLGGHPKGWVLSLARHGVPTPLLEQGAAPVDGHPPG